MSECVRVERHSTISLLHRCFEFTTRYTINCLLQENIPVDIIWTKRTLKLPAEEEKKEVETRGTFFWTRSWDFPLHGDHHTSTRREGTSSKQTVSRVLASEAVPYALWSSAMDVRIQKMIVLKWNPLFFQQKENILNYRRWYLFKMVLVTNILEAHGNQSLSRQLT